MLGALIVSPLLEMLRDPNNWKGYILFYVALVGGVVFAFRFSRRLGIVIAGTVAFGFAVHAIASAIDPAAVSGEHTSGTGGVAGSLGRRPRRTSRAGRRRCRMSA